MRKNLLIVKELCCAIELSDTDKCLYMYDYADTVLWDTQAILTVVNKEMAELIKSYFRISIEGYGVCVEEDVCTFTLNDLQ